eukprot:5703838-Pyramimonas_sp.AAC.1
MITPAFQGSASPADCPARERPEGRRGGGGHYRPTTRRGPPGTPDEGGGAKRTATSRSRGM